MAPKIRSFFNFLLHNDSVLLSAAILFLCIFIYRQFIFGKDFFIWTDLGSDTVNSYWPAYEYLSNAIKQGPEAFSLEIGLGSNFFSGSLLFFDPFIGMYLPTDAIGIARLLIYVHILKLLIGALFFRKFLSYFIKSRYVIFIFSLLYAFNSFMVVWGQHYYFGTIAMIFPMIFTGIEKALNERKYLLLIISTALGFICSYYFMYMAAFFLGLYLPARVYFLDGKNHFSVLKKLSLLGGLFLAGAGISAIVLFPTVAATLNTTRVKAQMIDFQVLSLANIRTYLTIIGSLFSNSLLGSTDSFIGVANYYDSPHLYCGLLSLLILPQIFVSGTFREKIFAITLLAFSVVILIFPFAAIVLNGFSTISYRWTYFVIFFILLLGAMSFNQLEDRKPIHQTILKFTLHILLIMSLGVTLAYFILRVPILDNTIRINSPVIADTFAQILPVILFLSIYTFFIGKYSSWKFGRSILLGIIFLEIAWSSSTTILGRTPFSMNDINNKKSYFDYSVEAVNYIKKIDPGFYRIDKSYVSQFWNDPLMQDYRSYTAYWSILPGSTLKFFSAVGGSTALNTQLGLISSTTIRSLLSVKYYLTKSVDKIPQGHELVKQFGDVYILKNNDWVPMGATYHSFVTETDLNKLAVDQRAVIMAKAGILPDELAKSAIEMGMQQLVISAAPSGNAEDKGKQTQIILNEVTSEKLALVTSRDDYIDGTITTKAGGVVFFPITYDVGWEVYVNGIKTKPVSVNMGLLGVLVKSGSYHLTLKYVPPYFIAGLVTSLISSILVGLFFGMKDRLPFLSLRKR